MVNKVHFVVILILSISIIINLFPLPEIITPYKPPLLMLVLIYWSLAFPNQINLTYAFVFGIIMDILLMMPLGYNAFLYTITIYLIIIYYPQIRLHSYWNKMFSLLIILIPYFIMSTFTNNMLNIEYNLLEVLTSIIISVLIWPLLFSVLRFIRLKYTV